MPRRQEIVERYCAALRDVEEFELQVPPRESRHAWHLFVLPLRPDRLRIDRAEFVRKQTEMQIGVSVHLNAGGQ